MSSHFKDEEIVPQEYYNFAPWLKESEHPEWNPHLLDPWTYGFHPSAIREWHSELTPGDPNSLSAPHSPQRGLGHRG